MKQCRRDENSIDLTKKQKDKKAIPQKPSNSSEKISLASKQDPF